MPAAKLAKVQATQGCETMTPLFFFETYSDHWYANPGAAAQGVQRQPPLQQHSVPKADPFHPWRIDR